MALLSIDLGTTGVRAVMITPDGRQLSNQELEVPIQHGARGSAEQRVETFWRAMTSVTRQAVEQASIPPEQIAAVGFSHQRCTFALADDEGQPLTDFIVWMDQRGLPYLDKIREKIAPSQYYERTGLPIYYISSLTKLLWLRDYAPEPYRRAARIWPISNFMLARLGITDPPVDHATASFYGLMDTRQREWAVDVVELLGLDVEMLPRLVPPGTIVGELADGEAAEQLGLRTGTPLVIGGGDQQCAALGSGMIEPGQALINLGTATAIMAGVSGPVRDPAHIVPSVCHTVPDQWEMEGHTQASGIILRRFRDEFAPAESAVAGYLRRDPYELLTEQAGLSEVGAGGLLFLPTFNGTTAPIDYPYSSGVMLGLRLSHNRADVLRAILEGICFENRWILEQIQATGSAIDTVYIAGGGNRSPLWNQLHADILQRPVLRVATSNAAAVGAAICAGTAVGLFDDAREGVARLSQVAETYQSDPRLAAPYNRLYDLFRHAYTALRDTGIFQELYDLGEILPANDEGDDT
jgi:xylulokinase